MDVITIIVVGVVGVLALAVMVGFRKSAKTEALKDALKTRFSSLSDFDVDDIYVSTWNRNGFAIDRNRREMMLTRGDEVTRLRVDAIHDCQLLHDETRKLVLRILTDDFDNPHHDVVFLDWTHSDEGIDPDSMIYKSALEEGERWHGRISAMVKASSA